jgi:serine/threonine protein phosphatase PrpC
VPAHQLTTDPSLLHRLEAANARNRELVEDNQRLRRQLAHALGQRRAAATLEREQDPSPRRGDALR